MGGAQHENSVDRKYMDVSAVKVYDVVLSRSMTSKTNTKIMKLRISIASPARLFFQFLHPDTLFQPCCLNFNRVTSEIVFSLRIQTLCCDLVVCVLSTPCRASLLTPKRRSMQHIAVKSRTHPSQCRESGVGGG